MGFKGSVTQSYPLTNLEFPLYKEGSDILDDRSVGVESKCVIPLERGETADGDLGGAGGSKRRDKKAYTILRKRGSTKKIYQLAMCNCSLQKENVGRRGENSENFARDVLNLENF